MNDVPTKGKTMKRLLIAGVVVGITGLVAAGIYRHEESAPQQVAQVASRPTASPAAPAPVASAPVTTAAERIVLATTGGRILDTDGLSIKDFIGKFSPAARQGDAGAAYRVYQAEAVCGQVDLFKRLLVTTTGFDDKQRQAEASRLAATAQACENVTPSEMQERFTFLDQAIRAGNKMAMVDYRYEGPNGQEITNLNPNDPNFVAWKTNAHDYLQKLAATGDQTAWSILSTDYERGVITPKDYSAAIKYETALVASRNPKADPLAIGYVAEMAKAIPPADVQSAITQGKALAKQFPVRKG